MGDLSKNFSRHEFECPCCKVNVVDYELLNALEAVRAHFGESVAVTSGYRCDTHNKKVGGGKHSQHLLGKAADIKVRNVPIDAVVSFLNDKYADKFGIGVYTSWTHIDVRQKLARWG